MLASDQRCIVESVAVKVLGDWPVAILNMREK
jgi:hypothetical protein